MRNVSVADWLRTLVGDDHVLPVVHALVRYATYCDDPDWRSAGTAIDQLQLSMGRGAVVTAESGGFAGRTGGRVSGTRNIFLEGDWIGPNGQLADASVASGVAAARRAAQLFSPGSDHHGAR
jgi:hypothetical protein